MIYLSSFVFPDEDFEWRYRMSIKETYYQSIYPFYVLAPKGLREIIFQPLTFLYGGNGSGKSTALRVIAEKLGLKRSSAFNRTVFFDDYVKNCRAEVETPFSPDSCILTSDDVFDMMLDVRAINEGVDLNRAEVGDEYFRLRKEQFQLQSLKDYEHLRRITEARRKTKSKFVASEAGKSVRTYSNGENALMYFEQKIANDSLCLLDEPENSLSPKNQGILADMIAECVRYCGCQLVISTHSPFLLSLPGAKIIDLDHGGEVVKNWTGLENPRTYYDFFMRHREEFDEK